MSEVNPAIRGIKPPVTLAQANAIARIADRLEEDGDVDNPWATAIVTFKKVFKPSDGGWVKKEKQMVNGPGGVFSVAGSEARIGQGQGAPRLGDGGTNYCICDECGTRYAKKKGVQCSKRKCPKCGVALRGSKSFKTLVVVDCK